MQPIHYSHNTNARVLRHDADDMVYIKERLDQITGSHGCDITNDNFFAIYKSFYELVDRIPNTTLAVDVPYLIRSRPNDGTKLYSEETEISYNSKNVDAIGLGRFNRPKEPMFYGCAQGESSDEDNFLITACLESYKKLLDDTNREPYKYFTAGKFYVKSPFYVINLCLNDKLLAINPKMNARTEDFIEKIKLEYPDAAELTVNFWKFITDLAAKKEEIHTDHFITTAYWCAMWMYCKTVLGSTANGILYPSPITDNKGINLVLQPEIVDTNMQLRSVFMVKFERDENDPKQYRIFQCSEEVPVIDGKFKVTIDPNLTF